METSRDIGDYDSSMHAPPEQATVGFDALLSFRGRVNRGTFWLTWVGIFGTVILGGIGAAIAIPWMTKGNSPGTSWTAVVLGVAVLVTLLWMSLANYAKRWHDIDATAWLILLNLIPGIGIIVLIVLGVVPGTEGPNRFGPGPLRIRLGDE